MTRVFGKHVTAVDQKHNSSVVPFPLTSPGSCPTLSGQWCGCYLSFPLVPELSCWCHLYLSYNRYWHTCSLNMALTRTGKFTEERESTDHPWASKLNKVPPLQMITSVTGLEWVGEAVPAVLLLTLSHAHAGGHPSWWVGVSCLYCQGQWKTTVPSSPGGLTVNTSTGQVWLNSPHKIYL